MKPNKSAAGHNYQYQAAGINTAYEHYESVLEALHHRVILLTAIWKCYKT